MRIVNPVQVFVHALFLTDTHFSVCVFACDLCVCMFRGGFALLNGVWANSTHKTMLGAFVRMSGRLDICLGFGCECVCVRN